MNIINSSGDLYYSTDIKHNNSLLFTSLPFSDLSIDWRREEASTLNFKSPVLLTNGDRIRYNNSGRWDFGGQVYKISKSRNNLYDYECISYKRLYDTKIIASYNNKTSNYILKDLLKKNPNNFRYDGLKSKSNLRHISLSWNNKSLWEIIGNLAWLEYKAGNYINYYIDSTGRLVWEDIPSDKLILSVNDVINYDMKDDSADFITNAIIINQLNNSTLANVKSNNDLLLRWGVITEYSNCDLSTVNSKVDVSSGGSSGGSFKTTYYNKKISKYDNSIPKKVISIAKSVCNPKYTDKQNLKSLSNWVKSHFKYKYFYDTRHSINGSLNNGCGNCCETANLMVALGRAVGIKSRFCTGKSHIWSEFYINGGWFTIDYGNTSKRYYGSHLHTSTYGGPPYNHYDVNPW